ncbi:hypothetical protein JCM8547_007667 [Rhodosporidiobolus lusitaniae]
MSNKRSNPFSSTNAPSSKRSSASSSTLNSFFPTTHRPSPPSPLVHSDPITDRASTFIAHAAPIASVHAAEQLQSHVRNLRTTSHPLECSHEILGYRLVAPKAGKSGLESEDDWTVKDGGDDDGEGNGASTVRECLRVEGAVDVGVVVSRLYGGQMLGPIRFTHIRAVATQAIQRLAAAQLLPTLLARLSQLDAEIAALSSPSSSTSTASSSPSKPSPAAGTKAGGVGGGAAPYAALDIPKAERLVAAREKRLELLKKQKEKREEQERREMEELHEAAAREEEEEARRAAEEGREGKGAGDDGHEEGEEQVRGALREAEEEEWNGEDDGS